ncbi:hypothetical protein F5148DRAFT_1352371 [Russula earlei]|uniref:Uncharacterized protein n=1 Tax=Russula earlei TaxID=71964 RepID=A0ACC0UB13_9AGAM|nr:hypothetical protein F5148DRAFT_1352371 [Russula earlei]
MWRRFQNGGQVFKAAVLLAWNALSTFLVPKTLGLIAVERVTEGHLKVFSMNTKLKVRIAMADDSEQAPLVWAHAITDGNISIYSQGTCNKKFDEDTAMEIGSGINKDFETSDTLSAQDAPFAPASFLPASTSETSKTPITKPAKISAIQKGTKGFSNSSSHVTRNNSGQMLIGKMRSSQQGWRKKLTWSREQTKSRQRTYENRHNCVNRSQGRQRKTHRGQKNVYIIQMQLANDSHKTKNHSSLAELSHPAHMLKHKFKDENRKLQGQTRKMSKHSVKYLSRHVLLITKDSGAGGQRSEQMVHGINGVEQEDKPNDKEVPDGDWYMLQETKTKARGQCSEGALDKAVIEAYLEDESRL